MLSGMTADLEWLYARQRFGIHAGLSRVQALLSALGEPQRRFDSVLVGGTNGKGSVSASLSAMLRASGRRVALFSSPHLSQFSERFVVDGAQLSEAAVLSALEHVRPLAEKLGATFFEIVVALGALLFAREEVEMAVMEVGLGGRLDATNALDPVLSVITNVALDHTEILGQTKDAIAREKAGILRVGRPAVTGVDAELLPILQAQGADLLALPPLELRSLGFDGWQVGFTAQGQTLNFRTPLLGEHGARNAALAALAALRLGLRPADIARGAEQTRWPGRLELLPLSLSDHVPRQLLLDGAHNLDGARALVQALRSLGLERLPIIFGAAADKDIGGVAAALREVASEVILTRALLSPRAAEPAALAPYFAELPLRLADTPASALGFLPPGLSVACGSLYLIGELRPLLLQETLESMERWQ